ncbi:MAG: sodium/proline symporter [Gammaproteobacteria bacterium]|nr:MAG: sodium/proline symporter [Gammaproteobacteria bacterium]
MIISFVAFLLMFTAIGLLSARHSRGTKQDYYLASSSVSPWLVGLSAVATNNSGYMFIGVIGYTYTVGLSSIWLMLGWICGDFLASQFVHHRIREQAPKTAEVSYVGILSNWYGDRHNGLQRMMGLISLVFLLAYASAQLVAGSKALQVLFEWPSWAGATLSATLVTLYCFAGGIRASIWTDAAQSTVMIVAMGLLMFTTVTALGGVQSVYLEMSELQGFLDWYPSDLAFPGIFGGILFAVSWMFAGLSVIGQPHIMVRFMTLQDSTQMNRARCWYYLWYLAFYAMATGVGMLSRIYLSDTGSFDAELALPTMALELFPPLLVGLVLAGIFAATMSTADSLVLGCSATLTHDLLPHKVEKTSLMKAVTILVTLGALLWALGNSQSVFSLVVMAWSGLASAFAPLLLFLCLGKRPKPYLSLLAITGGLGCAMLWRWLGWHQAVYEGMAGILAGLLILTIGLQLGHRTQPFESASR